MLVTLRWGEFTLRSSYFTTRHYCSERQLVRIRAVWLMFGLLVQARIATWPAILMTKQTRLPNAGMEKGRWVRLPRLFLFSLSSLHRII